jgi:hypothetical protein
VTKPRVDLSWDVELREPALVDVDQVLHAVNQFALVKDWHVEVMTRLDKTINMLLSTEGLWLTCLGVLHDVQTLVTRDAVMQAGGCDWDGQWSIWSHLWLAPAVLIIPVDSKHVVCVALSEVVIFHLWLDHLWASLRYFDFIGLSYSWSA